MVKALTNIAIGMTVVVILAHPLVACFYEISYRFAIPPFYTAFVLGPLIGDSGVRVFDVIKYAKFKTIQTTSVALTALYVSAAVSNTLVFGVLVAIVFNRGRTQPLYLCFSTLFIYCSPFLFLMTHFFYNTTFFLLPFANCEDTHITSHHTLSKLLMTHPLFFS